MYFELVGEITEVDRIGTWDSRLGRSTPTLRCQPLAQAQGHRSGADRRWHDPAGRGTLVRRSWAWPSADEDRAVPGLMAAKKRYLLCVRNEGAEDLEPRKVSERLPDARAAKDGYVRVVDESGEDYLYPSGYFVAVDPPREAERALASGAR